jgi:hypothetical protein
MRDEIKKKVKHRQKNVSEKMAEYMPEHAGTMSNSYGNIFVTGNFCCHVFSFSELPVWRCFFFGIPLFASRVTNSYITSSSSS